MFDTRYPIPEGSTRVEDDIKKSRFITTIAHTPTVEDAKAFVRRVRDEFPDATHNCWAYVVGPPGSSRDNGMSDDGEPGGTAGRPMLSALHNSGVGDVAVVVTRYFGGTRLGRGGLVRAYGGGVQRALREMARSERVERVTIDVTIPYAAVDIVRRVCTRHESKIDREAFGTDAVLTVTLPRHHLDDLSDALRDATGGAVVISRSG